MKGSGGLVAGLGWLTGIIVGATSEWYFGAAVFIVICAPFFIFVYSAARCPHCGQVWWAEGTRWARYGGVEYPPTEDETESMVCRRCRLDIGVGLIKP